MTITAQQVFDYLPKSADRSAQGDAQELMQTICDAVEELWLARWSMLIADDEGALPDPRPTYIDVALMTQAGKLWDDRKVPGGTIAGSEFGPFRVNRFHPNVESMLNDDSWGVA